MNKATKLMERYFQPPFHGLRAYFQRVRSGSDTEYRTTFFPDRSVQEVLERWASTLSRIKSKWPTLFEFENDLRRKVGPMSIMKPLEQRLSDIDSYYESILLDSVPIDPRAIDLTCYQFSNARGIRLRSQYNTNELMKKSTNSGNPYFTRKRLVEELTIPFSIDNKTNMQYLPKWNGPMTAILGWRGQEGGPSVNDVKQRVVWMFPYALNVAELQFYQPMITAFQKHNLVPAWVSMDAVDHRITDLFDSKAPNQLVICTDFTKFDQHINSDLQDAAKQVINNLLSPSDVGWLEQVFPIKYEIPLCYDWGHFRFGKHGMASGSGGTNADETLLHTALQHESAVLNNQVLNPYSMCLGDDGLLSYPKITVDKVVDSYTRHGLDMNVDKQYSSTDDCVYLRRWHHKDYRINGVCVGVYSTFRALGRLCEQERYYDPDIWSAKMVALRQLSILENVKFHPLREEFANYCMKGDKYRLGIDIPGFLDNIQQLAIEATDIMPDFLGYTKGLEKGIGSGINNWWIVNYLKSKR